MLTNSELFATALSYFGIEDPSQADSGLSARIRSAYNWTMQTLFAKGPNWLKFRDFSEVLLPPQQIGALTIQQYQKTIAGEAIAPGMVGCTIRLSGEQLHNELTSPTSLLNPTLQPNTAIATATVFGDSVILPANFLRLSGNVFLDERWWELKPLFYHANQLFKDHIERTRFRHGIYSNVCERFRFGLPIGYWVQPVDQLDTNGVNRQRLRVWPLPMQAHIARCEIEIAPPEIAIEDLSTNAYISIPAGFHETIFRPLMLIELARDPHFLKSKAADLESEDEVFQKLDRLVPQADSGARLRPPYSLSH